MKNTRAFFNTPRPFIKANITSAGKISLVQLILIIFLGLPLMFIASTLWFIYSGREFSWNNFDKTTWLVPRTNRDDGGCYRGGMAKDIKENVLKKGMSPDEVTQLLGTPDGASPSEFQYGLGMCSGIGIDFDNLHVYFDSNKKFVRAAIVQH